MTRRHLTALILASSSWLAGCNSDFTLHHWFHRTSTACCTEGSGCCSPDGVVSGFEGPVLPAPETPPAGTDATPQGPPVTSPPRLVPAPATPMPYSP